MIPLKNSHPAALVFFSRWPYLAVALSLGLGAAALLAGPAPRLRAASGVDIGVTQTASAPAAFGAPLTYTVVITNSSVALDGPVTLTDTLPGGLTPVTVTTTPAADCTLGSQVVCTFAALGAETSATAAIVVNPAGAGVITNVVEVGVSVSDTESLVQNNILTLTTDVVRATPVITWAAPAALTYGAALGAGQLNAAASVAGTFTYTPTFGAVLDAGPGQGLTVSFQPNDSANYTSASAGVSIDVAPAPLTATANNQSKVYGAGLPALTVGYTGLVNGDAGPAVAPTLGTTATASSPAGAYAITVTGGSDPNYTFTRVA
ncbi:MAG: DUF11 domain-containing protein, partial [Anaerolineales bacterium]|nr:DUF11 domain-containing protein [Anaerolineales bacterium]